MTAEPAPADPDATGIAGHKKGRVPAEVRTQQLLDVAEELFADRGYDATSVEDIARAAGVTRPMVYGRLGNKEEAYLAVVARVRAELEERMTTAALAVTPPRERLREGAAAFFAYLEQEPRRWTILYGSSTPIVGDLGVRLTDARFGTVARIADLLRLQTDATEETVETLAHLISGALEQIGRWWLRNPGVDSRDLADRVVEVLWGGIAPYARD